ncbi:hypothetical protein ACFO1B_55950 [Dactylosporangium siamense]|uniref:Uncharacterized protein n=1 Tax=Dactylosporangium siamense TaxID=685454 RepID=A0A919PZA7_9ACTN|nr:hypothetical protein [Dactylosporangium siamense]GIG53116.1 hypothetical protein Dsi01nite_111570 [Dactylosporangium siamense]
MKFWELFSVARTAPDAMLRLGDMPEWTEYLAWWHDRAALIRARDNAKLDLEMPDEACRHVLEAVPNRYWIAGGTIRGVREGTPEPTYSAVEIFDRFGGSILEEVDERGSARVPDLGG